MGKTGYHALVRIALLLILTTACSPSVWSLAGAEQKLKGGDPRAARDEYDKMARRAKTPAQRADALTGAALACREIGDATCTHDRLERAIVPEIPGTTEVALYYLAESLEKVDRARAMNLYYRAASSAEQHRARGFPYQAATDRIMKLSMSQH
jgi:hypothetical protein